MIRVLHTLAAPDGTTRYVDHMLGSAPPDVHVLTFSWPRAIFGRYDVLHVHWPEYLVRHRSRVGQFAKRTALRVLLARLRWTRTPIVRTAHNREPHESGSAREHRLIAMIDERTMLWIRLNPTTEVAPGASSIDIPHGHYREVYSGEDHPPVAGRILQFGLLRPYKGVETLISAFQLLHEPSASLRLVGRPYTAEYGARIRDLCAETAAISLKLEFVPDSELAEEVRRAELVVLPYTEMHNSGAILVALSLARPVLAPRTRANEMLAEEVGAGWIELFDGVLERSDIESALRAIRSSERGRAPDLSSRDWSVVGQRHRDAYLRALDRRDT